MGYDGGSSGGARSIKGDTEFRWKRGQGRFSKEDEHFFCCVFKRDLFSFSIDYYLEIASMYKSHRPSIQLSILIQTFVLLVWNFTGVNTAILSGPE